jgi:hypothetical protein
MQCFRMARCSWSFHRARHVPLVCIAEGCHPRHDGEYNVCRTVLPGAWAVMLCLERAFRHNQCLRAKSTAMTVASGPYRAT